MGAPEATNEVGLTSGSKVDTGRTGGGRRDLVGPARSPCVPGMLEVLLVMVAVEDGEAEHAACDLLSLLLQLGQVLLGIICKSPGG